MYFIKKLRDKLKELGELHTLCDALWKEVKENRDLIRSLRDENAAVQLAFYELDHGRTQTVRVPDEVCVSTYGRCFHARDCHTIRGSVFKAYYPCRECHPPTHTGDC